MHEVGVEVVGARNGSHRAAGLVARSKHPGLEFSGVAPPRRLIELAIEGEAVELFSSPVLLDELART